MGIFKNNGGNIPLGDFLGGISPGGEGGSFVGWNFPGWSFPDTNLKIEWYLYCDPLVNNINDHVLKCIAKYRNHLCELAIGELYNKNRRQPFSFSKIERNKVLSDILKLDAIKGTNPLIIAKENADIFANVLVSKFNDSTEKSNFPSILENAIITPVFKNLSFSLHAYGFSIAALRLIHSYLTNRWQRTKLNLL